ncbi:MAG: aspartyl-phosphate phosphatase Spo0E family protein [Eubacteriales bacterium]
MGKNKTLLRIEELRLRLEIVILIKRIKKLRRMLLDLVINADTAGAPELLTISQMLDEVMNDYNRLVIGKT